MSEYLLTVTGIVLISMILTNFLPCGKTYALIKNVLRLCAYLSILTPIFNFVGKQIKNNSDFFCNYFNENVIEVDTSYIQYVSKKTIAQTEAKLKERLETDYTIEVNVLIECGETNEFGEVAIEKIIIEGKDISAEIQEKIRTNFEIEYSVEIEFTKGG